MGEEHTGHEHQEADTIGDHFGSWLSFEKSTCSSLSFSGGGMCVWWVRLTTKFVLGIENAVDRPGRQESKCQWQRNPGCSGSQEEPEDSTEGHLNLKLRC